MQQASHYFSASWHAQQLDRLDIEATQPLVEPSLVRFVEALSHRYGATRVLLFGSRARCTVRRDSDYDIIVISSAFEHVHPLEREIGMRPLWYASGGAGPMDIVCLT